MSPLPVPRAILSSAFVFALVSEAAVVERHSSRAGLRHVDLRRESGRGNTNKSKRVLRVAGPMQLTGSFSSVGLKAKAAFEIWRDWGAGGYTIELDLVDDGSSVPAAVKLAAGFAADDSVDAIVAPYSSTASLAVVKAIAGRKMVLVWGGADVSIFQTGFEKVFGFFNLAPDYMSDGLKALWAKGARDVAIIQNERIFSKGVCSGAKDQALELGMTVMQELTVKSDGSDVADATRKLRDQYVDVTVICGQPKDVEALTEQMLDPSRGLNFKTNMVLATQVANPAYRAHVKEAGLHIDDCMLMPSQWQNSAVWNQKDEVVGWTSSDFSTLFEDKFGSPPNYQAASAAAAGVALSNAIKNAGGAGSLDNFAQVEAAMTSLEITTFYGPISFLKGGSPSAKRMFTLQNLPGSSGTSVVSPPSAAEADLIYPMSECPVKAAATLPSSAFGLRLALLLILAGAQC